jgi:hypothetical protein
MYIHNAFGDQRRTYLCINMLIFAYKIMSTLYRELIYIYICIYIYIYIYTHIYIYIYIHIYVHIYILFNAFIDYIRTYICINMLVYAHMMMSTLSTVSD